MRRRGCAGLGGSRASRPGVPPGPGFGAVLLSRRAPASCLPRRQGRASSAVVTIGPGRYCRPRDPTLVRSACVSGTGGSRPLSPVAPPGVSLRQCGTGRPGGAGLRLARGRRGRAGRRPCAGWWWRLRTGFGEQYPVVPGNGLMPPVSRSPSPASSASLFLVSSPGCASTASLTRCIRCTGLVIPPARHQRTRGPDRQVQ